MSRPLISVVLNTARSSYAMTGYPNKHHLEFTCEALAESQFTDFELIVSDVLYEQRKLESTKWWAPLDGVVEVYHTPVRQTEFVKRHYCAIAATKNSGALYGEGDLFLWLDDCCRPGPEVIRRFAEWYGKGYFASAMHIRTIAGKESARDSRFLYFDLSRGNVDAIRDGYLVNGHHNYGYASYGREAFFLVNGFDEFMDGSRQLEDVDMGLRMQRAGYQLVLDKDLVIVEEEHLTISAGGAEMDPNRVHTPDVIPWGPPLKCNGIPLFMREERFGKDKYLANHRKLMSHEWQDMGGTGERCKYRTTDNRCGALTHKPLCNWVTPEGAELNMVLPDAQLYKAIEPISFADEHPMYLMDKSKYQLC